MVYVYLLDLWLRNLKVNQAGLSSCAHMVDAAPHNSTHPVIPCFRRLHPSLKSTMQKQCKFNSPPDNATPGFEARSAYIATRDMSINEFSPTRFD